MKLSQILKLNAVVALLFALALLVMPVTVLTLYRLRPDPGLILMARFFAVGLVAIGLITGLARNVTDVEALKAITRGLAVSDFLGLVLSATAVAAGVTGSFGWTVVIIYLFFALSYAYFGFAKTGIGQSQPAA